MHITKKFIERLEIDPHGTLRSLSVDDIKYVVKKANEAYHSKGVPLISDTLFDQIKTHLERVSNGDINVDVGAAPVSGKKAKLPCYMGSMDKIKTDDKALKSFKSRYSGPYVMTDKLDGVSSLLHVTDAGVKMYTRGDGRTGQDITHLLQLIKNVPSAAALAKISRGAAGELTVRGELIISKIDFEQFKARGANARNMVSGIVNAKLPHMDIARRIQFIAHSLITPQMSPSEMYEFLVANGFTIVHYKVFKTLWFDEMSEFLVQRRKGSPFDVDGIVVSQDRYYPVVDGKNPAHAFAFKNIITQETAEVIVTNVEWNASKDGYLVPVVEFEPVKLAGVMVKRASGFNGEYIHSNSIGPGARIVVTRSGDVIPYILQILEKARKPQMPNEKFVWTATGKDIFLEHADMNVQVRQRTIENFFTKLDVPGLKSGTVAKLYNAGLDNLEKILNASVQRIASIDGFQQKSAENIVAGIRERLSKVKCAELMDASNSFGRGFGLRRLTAILDAIPMLLNDRYTPPVEQLTQIDSVSEKTAAAFLQGLVAYRSFKANLNIKCQEGANKEPDVRSCQSSCRFRAHVLVFTGYRPSEQQKKQIEEEGGTIDNNLTKKTTMLIANDLEQSTGKLEKAMKYGVRQIYSKTEFENKYF